MICDRVCQIIAHLGFVGQSQTDDRTLENKSRVVPAVRRLKGMKRKKNTFVERSMTES